MKGRLWARAATAYEAATGDVHGGGHVWEPGGQMALDGDGVTLTPARTDEADIGTGVPVDL
jgi:hypothetical protein